MAQFDNVNYTYYSDTLGRAIIPTAEDFNALKLENIQLMKSWLPCIKERQGEDFGIDAAVCLMIEVDYQDTQTLNGGSASAISSESIGGHSVSYGTTAKNKLEELNALSTKARKLEKVKLFCDVETGVK